MQYHFIRSSAIAAIAAGMLYTVVPATAQFRETPEARAARIQEAAARPTPRMPDGKPDLSGYWADPRELTGFDGVPVSISEDGKTIIYGEPFVTQLDARAQVGFKRRAADSSRRPSYKPEFASRQRELMHTASLNDPSIHCYPGGVPRIGAPTEITQTATTVYLLYAGEFDEDITNTFRVIRIGASHDPEADLTPDGDSIGWWEGDTLVVSAVNLDPTTWLDGDGDFHSDALHVVERFTRKGDTLEYDVTVSDPKLFTKPWKPVYGQVMGNVAGRPGSRTRILGNPGQHSKSNYPCVERDRENKVNNDRF